jgi:LysR family transcriptional regulator, cyn operon transcriptional activator
LHQPQPSHRHGLVSKNGPSPLATLLPDAIARERPELRLVDLKGALPQQTAALLLRKGAYRSAAAQAFIELALAGSANELRDRRAKLPL